jgi:hypothetical protein
MVMDRDRDRKGDAYVSGLDALLPGAPRRVGFGAKFTIRLATNFCSLPLYAPPLSDNLGKPQITFDLLLFGRQSFEQHKTYSALPAMALPLPAGLVPSEVAFLCEMELVTVVPRQRLESIQLLGVSLP